MSFPYDEKRATVITKLMRKTFDKDITDIGLTENGLLVIFTNKPKQPVMCCFPLVDTWDKIKVKIQKLIDSDGVCVVCFKKEKLKHLAVNTCDTCCEFICEECNNECYKSKVQDTKSPYKGHLCPVCQTCSIDYLRKVQDDECHLCVAKKFQMLWNEYLDELEEKCDPAVFSIIDDDLMPKFKKRLITISNSGERKISATLQKVIDDFKSVVASLLFITEKVKKEGLPSF
jgi:hypothetical protein